MEKIKIDLPVIVEGKYDKITLSNIIDAKIIVTDGFGIFNSREKMLLLKRLSEKGIIVMTDSDGAGKVIRSHIKSAVPPDKIYDLYTPRVEGREKRKSKPSKEGTLGVEGIDSDTLRAIFADFAKKHGDGTGQKSESVTKADFYFAGITGDGSSARRDAFAQWLGLPPGMTPNALLAAVNILLDRDEFLEKIRIFSNE